MSATTLRLLIADDEYWVRENLKTLVDWNELMITLTEPAVDGEDAIRKIEKERPDILVTDINMPFISGNEVIKIARDRYPRLPVIVLSGYSDFAFVREALLCGAVDYLLKPVSKNALLDVLDKTLLLIEENRERERQRAESREKLLRAASALRDGELSALIADDVPGPVSDATLAELELKFAAFTLLLVKLARPAKDGAKSGLEAPRLSREIKNALSRAGGVAFRNIYAHDEYVLLADNDIRGVERLCRDLPVTLGKCTGLHLTMGVSRTYYSFNHLREAYREARSALMARVLSGESSVIRVEDALNISIRKRISFEQENSLHVACRSKNRSLAGEVIFDQIGLGNCSGGDWLLIEVRNTAEYVAGIVFHHASAGAAPRAILAMENFTYLLDSALESQDTKEMQSLLDQLLDEAIGESGAPIPGDSMKRTIQDVQAYIEENYFTELSLTSLARQFRVERSYLSKSFKLVTGYNLMLAIAKRRIEKAEEYIRGADPQRGDLSLADISNLVGYDEYAYFNRVFRKISGVSPSEYRAKARRGGNI